MPRPKRRNRKGTVAINIRNGMIRLRFTHLSQEYHLSLGLPSSPINLQSARGIAADIEKDIALGTCDRILTMTPLIRTTLEGRSQGQTEGLVFTSPTGRPIDDGNFCTRIWHRLCEKANVPYRRPYNARHSVASHALRQGASMPDVARLLGHTNTRMIAQVYGKSVDRPQLPEF